MIKQLATKWIPVSAINVGPRLNQPSDSEIDDRTDSIQRLGLINPISVRSSGDGYNLVCGATRLAAVKRLGWDEILAVICDGTPEELKSAEIIENLERRQYDSDQRRELEKEYVKLCAQQIRVDEQKKLEDNPTDNSSQTPSKTHPKTKVEGTKRGRPTTPEGQAKKEIARKTGQSERSVRRHTSDKPKSARESAGAKRDKIGLGHLGQVRWHLQEIYNHLFACDRDTSNMIRKEYPALLDVWFSVDKKLKPPEELGLARGPAPQVVPEQETSAGPAAPVSLEPASPPSVFDQLRSPKPAAQANDIEQTTSEPVSLTPAGTAALQGL